MLYNIFSVLDLVKWEKSSIFAPLNNKFINNND